MLGFLLGLVVSCGIIVVQFLVDDRLRSSDDIEKYVQLPTLGVMPKQSKKPAAKSQNTPNRRNSKKESEQK